MANVNVKQSIRLNKKEIQNEFYLGENVFIGTSNWDGDFKVYIQRFRPKQNKSNSCRNSLCPTRIGISLSLNQLKMLENYIPSLLSRFQQQRKLRLLSNRMESNDMIASTPTSTKPQGLKGLVAGSTVDADADEFLDPYSCWETDTAPNGARSEYKRKRGSVFPRTFVLKTPPKKKNRV